MKTQWDYTDRAHTYDKRADYSGTAIANFCSKPIACRTKL